MFSFESLMTKFAGSATKATPKAQRRLRLENLEDRLVPAAATNLDFVKSAVQVLENRPFNASTDQTFVDQLNAGTATLTTTAVALQKTTDGINFQVKQLFNQLLNREADATGLATFGGMLQNGAKLQDVRAQIMSTDEFFTHAGGTNDKFIAATFANILGRTVDPIGQAFFSGELNSAAQSATANRLLVATQVIQSPEGALKETLTVFNHYLQRQADLTGLVFFGSQMINSPLFGGQVVDEHSVISSLVGSQEFFDASTTT